MNHSPSGERGDRDTDPLADPKKEDTMITRKPSHVRTPDGEVLKVKRIVWDYNVAGTSDDEQMFVVEVGQLGVLGGDRVEFTAVCTPLFLEAATYPVDAYEPHLHQHVEEEDF